MRSMAPLSRQWAALQRVGSVPNGHSTNCIARNDNFDAAILLSAHGGLVGRGRASTSISGGGNRAGGDPLGNQHVAHVCGQFLGESSTGGSGTVGVPFRLNS